MGYQAVYPMEEGSRRDAYRFAAADVNGGVCAEPWDGTRLYRHTACGLYLYKRFPEEEAPARVLAFDGISAEVLVTDSRVVLWFYAEQGGFRTEVLRSGSQTVGDESSFSGQKDGPVRTAGMIRYEWLSQISYQHKISRNTEECLRLYYRDTDDARWYLELVFSGGEDAEYLANTILHRACRYRLAMTDEKSDKELYFLNRYRQDNEIEPAAQPKYEMSTIRFPTQYPAPGGAKYRPGMPE